MLNAEQAVEITGRQRKEGQNHPTRKMRQPPSSLRAWHLKKPKHPMTLDAVVAPGRRGFPITNPHQDALKNFYPQGGFHSHLLARSGRNFLKTALRRSHSVDNFCG